MDAAREHTFQTGEAQLRVRNPAGLVEIEARETSETTVRLEALRDDEVTRSAIEGARVESRDGEVVVEIAKGGWGFLGRSPAVGIRITCPAGSSLDCTTASADVTVLGPIAGATVKTASGDVALDRATGGLALETASGDVRVTAAEGSARLKTVSGDIVLETLAGDGTLGTVSGDVEVGAAAGPLAVTTVSGDQRVRSIRAGEIRLESVSGDVEVGVATGTRVRIDASSTSGDVGSELDVREAPAPSSGEGSEAELRLRTVSGDIGIRRAPAQAAV